MKNRKSIPLKIGGVALVSALSVSLWIVARKRHQILYPYSPVYVDRDGKADPKVDAWLASSTQESPDKSTLTMDLGSTTADARDDMLGCFSPMILTHPDTRIFIVSWDASLLGTSYCFELTYDRSAGIFTEKYGCEVDTPIKILGRNLTDRDLHDAVVSTKGYEDWASKH